MGKGEWVKGVVKCKVQPIDESSDPVWEKHPGWLHCSGYFGARKDEERKIWWLIHLPTGFAISNFNSLKIVKAVVNRLLEVDIDWWKAKRRDQEKETKLPMIRKVYEICRSAWQ